MIKTMFPKRSIIRRSCIFTISRLVFCLSFIVGAQASAASVASVSSELLEQVGEEAYWQSTVQCESNSTRVVIRQKLKATQWCVTGEQLPCASSKLKMAEEVCANIAAFSTARPNLTATPARPRAVEQTNAASKAEKNRLERAARAKAQATKAEEEAVARQRMAQAATLKAEELKLQAERAELERERLSIQQTELELDKRVREIDQQLGELDN